MIGSRPPYPRETLKRLSACLIAAMSVALLAGLATGSASAAPNFKLAKITYTMTVTRLPDGSLKARAVYRSPVKACLTRKVIRRRPFLEDWFFPGEPGPLQEDNTIYVPYVRDGLYETVIPGTTLVPARNPENIKSKRNLIERPVSEADRVIFVSPIEPKGIQSGKTEISCDPTKHFLAHLSI